MKPFARGASALALTVAIAACGVTDSNTLAGPTLTGPDSIFQRYVAIGNSITAGWQSGGINDSTQRQSYAYLLAQQMGTRFAYPSFAAFGCPAPMANFVTRKLIDSLVPAGQKQPCYLRSSSSVAEILNNVAVPYAYAADLTSAQTNIIPGNALWSFILGGQSEIGKALQADPTFATVWVGNNETLIPASFGVVNGPAVGVAAPPLIPPTVWIPQYAAAINALKAGAPHLRGGVLMGAVDVTNAPRFFPVDSLVSNTTLKTNFDKVVGATTTILGCGASGLLLSTQIIDAIRAGQHPALISCVKNTPQAPIGDVFMLDPTEVATFQATTAAYNTYIKAKADSIGFAYVDPNALLLALKQQKAIPVVPNFASTKAPFGTYLSLDGAHPAAPAHKLAANALIAAINAKYGTNLPTIP